jgi:hypothetical protein
MTLLNQNDMPPHGYLYFEPALNWRAPKELALQGLPFVAKALQLVRAQNPASGLDPGYEACVRAVGEYTCARLARWPKVLKQFCGGVAATEQERVQLEVAEKEAGRPRGCAGCGGGRRR